MGGTVVPGLLITSVVAVAMTTALFTRRSRSGWLHELDGIRGDALVHPGSGLTGAMAGGEDRDDGLGRAAAKDARVTAVVAALAMGDGRASGALPPIGDTSWFDAPPADPPLSHAMSPHRASPDRVSRMSPHLVSPDAEPEATPPPPPSTRPAPHPMRPQDLWHPATEQPLPTPTGPPPVEERLDPSELDDSVSVDDGSAPRFRFARLGPMPRIGAGQPVRPPEVPEPLRVGLDGTVNIAHGTLRVGDGPVPRVQRDPGGIVVELRKGWCWSSVGDDATIVTAPQGTLTVSAGATALAVVETDGSTFLAVVSGEAALVHAGGPRRLPAGALVLMPCGGEPQVDVASADEIAADPLVARNRTLDAAAPAPAAHRDRRDLVGSGDVGHG